MESKIKKYKDILNYFSKLNFSKNIGNSVIMTPY